MVSSQLAALMAEFEKAMADKDAVMKEAQRSSAASGKRLKRLQAYSCGRFSEDGNILKWLPPYGGFFQEALTIGGHVGQ
eukprot:4885942-Amphidinium_carterae.1